MLLQSSVMEQRIGEVIEASSTEFTAQSDELYAPPALGSLVTVRNEDTVTYALVYYAETVSFEPGRQPVARGAGLTDQEEVYRQHPELAQLLRTVFAALVVGHHDGDRFLPYLPSHPVRVHAFVHPAAPGEGRDVSKGLGFLSALLQSPVPTGDEFIAASLRELSTSHPDPESFLVEAGRQIALYLRGDTPRLQALLLRLKR